MLFCERLDSSKSNVMPRPPILRSGIPQTYNKALALHVVGQQALLLCWDFFGFLFAYQFGLGGQDLGNGCYRLFNLRRR